MTDLRRPLALAGIVFVLTFAVYGTMLPSMVAVGDQAEAQTVPYILGIAHPTGFPAYTLAGWAFSHALAFGTVAWRLNAFTALSTALGAAGVFLLGFTLAGSLAGAAFAALAFAFGGTVWSGALNANVQTPAAACSVWALLGAVLFARCGDVRALVAACALCGVGIATHPSAIWIVPAIVTAAAWQYARLTPRIAAAALFALLLPLVCYAYLPLRSAFVTAHGLDPAAAAPLYGAGNFDWNTNNPQTQAGFVNEVLARKGGVTARVAMAFDPHAFLRATSWWIDATAAQYRIWLVLLGAAGIAALLWFDRRALSVLSAGTLGGIFFAYSYRADTHIDRYVFVSFAVIAALSVAVVRIGAYARVATIAALALLAGFAFGENRPPPPSIYDNGERIIAAVRSETPDGSIVVAQWNDAAALGYGAFVEHALGSRTIVSAWPGDYAEGYFLWAKARPVRVLVSPFATYWPWRIPVPMQPQLTSLRGYGLYAVLPEGAAATRMR